MLVNFQGDTLLVEGDNAYSITEVKTKYQELKDKILQCELDVQSENAFIQEHTKIKDKAVRDHESYTEELKSIEIILEKIRKAEIGLELSKAATPINTNKLDVSKNEPAPLVLNANAAADVSNSQVSHPAPQQDSKVEVGAESLKKVFGRRVRV